MYSGVYYACDVTLSVYPHRARLKNMPDHDGNRSYDLWNTNPMLCQLSYAVWSVRVCDISEHNLVPSISMLSPSRRREAPCEGTNSPRLFTPGETKTLAKSKVHQISRA